MLRYTGKRIATGMLSLFVLATVTFFLIHYMPGSPFQSGAVSPQVVEALEKEYGLGEPLFIQYLSYMGGLLKGNLGISYAEPGTSAAEIIGRAWPLTASLGLAALLTAVLVGTALGILRAVSGRRAVKGIISAGEMLAAGIPGFAAAFLLLFVFSMKLKLLPVSGLLSPAHYILPTVSLALYPAAVISRLLGNALETELRKEYVVFARMKGLGAGRIVLTHALKNAYLPVLRYLGPASAYLLTGSFAAESIFNIPGLGREFVNSITNRDYTLIMALTIFMGTVVILANLLTDLLCAWLEPRTRRQLSESSASGRG